HLPAQEVLALLLLGTVLDTVVNALAHLELRQAIALELQREFEALDDVERLEQLQLLAEVEGRRVAGGVGPGAGIGNRPHERADAPVVAAQLENLVNDRAVFALQLARDAGRRVVVGTRFAVHAQDAVLIGGGAAEDRAMQTGQGYGETTSGEAHPIRYFSDNPDFRVCNVPPGNQEHPIVGAHVNRKRDRHARKRDRVVQRDDSQPVHSATIVGTLLDIVNY